MVTVDVDRIDTDRLAGTIDELGGILIEAISHVSAAKLRATKEDRAMVTRLGRVVSGLLDRMQDELPAELDVRPVGELRGALGKAWGAVEAARYSLSRRGSGNARSLFADLRDAAATARRAHRLAIDLREHGPETTHAARLLGTIGAPAALSQLAADVAEVAATVRDVVDEETAARLVTAAALLQDASGAIRASRAGP